MAYTLLGVDPLGHNIIKERASIKGRVLSCYDVIGDPEFAADLDEVLHVRSALELVRDELTEDQRQELDEIDAYWQANAQDFNAAFAVFHHQENKETALEGFIEDGHGDTPTIPRAHWWWRAVEAE